MQQTNDSFLLGEGRPKAPHGTSHSTEGGCSRQMTRSFWEKDGRRPACPSTWYESFHRRWMQQTNDSFLLGEGRPKAPHVLRPGTSHSTEGGCSRQMTRSFWEKDGRRPRMSFNLVRVISAERFHFLKRVRRWFRTLDLFVVLGLRLRIVERHSQHERLLGSAQPSGSLERRCPR